MQNRQGYDGVKNRVFEKSLKRKFEKYLKETIE